MKSVAAYHFETRPAEALPPLRERLLADANRRRLKGQILIASEGINLFVAGHDEDVDAFIDDVRAEVGGELQLKVSHSDDVPFNRLLVKIKAQIIAFDDPRPAGSVDVDPARRSAPRVSAQTLKTWLDEGRPLTLLDTRNDYEVRMGTFQGARHLNVRHFRDFGRAFVAGRDGLDLDGDVVLFCTGGIRCEKAAPFLQSLGVDRVMQLDGGILRYFEDCGAAHFDGECFVFDKRVGVDADLKPTRTVMCFRCRMPLSVLDQQSPDYVYEVHCPYCVGQDARSGDDEA